MAETVFVFGASGHAKVVIETITSANRFQVALVVDDDVGRHGTVLLGYRIQGGRNDLIAARGRVSRGVVAIGDNTTRLNLAIWLEEAGFRFVSTVDSSAHVSGSAEIGLGSVVLPMAAINADARIGCHVIVNTGASIDHDCVIDDGVHIGPGSRVCGGVRIGRGVLIGAGSTIVPGVAIGAGAVVGAGSVVLADVPAGARVAGSPARPLWT